MKKRGTMRRSFVLVLATIASILVSIPGILAGQTDTVGSRNLLGSDRVRYANAGVTGTTLNKLAKLTGAPSTAIITATTDTAGIIGIVVAGAGTTGSADIAYKGKASCVFSTATVAGHYVVNSGTSAGECADSGASTYPTTGQVIGVVTATNGGAGTYEVDLTLGQPQAGGGAGLADPGSNGIITRTALNVTAPATANGIALILTCAAASASGIHYTCSTSPTFVPAANAAVWFVADVANTTSCDLNVNASTIKPIKKQGGSVNLIANDLLAGQRVMLIYDGTNWQMQGQTGNASAAGSDVYTVQTVATLPNGTLQSETPTGGYTTPLADLSANTEQGTYVLQVFRVGRGGVV